LAVPGIDISLEIFFFLISVFFFVLLDFFTVFRLLLETFFPHPHPISLSSFYAKLLLGKIIFYKILIILHILCFMKQRSKNIFSIFFILITIIFVIFSFLNVKHLFTHKKIEYTEYSTDAIFRTEKMLLPVVKLTHIGLRESDNTIFSVSATGFSIAYDIKSDSSLIITNDHFCSDLTDSSSLYIEDYSLKLIDFAEQNSELRIMKSNPALDLCVLQSYGFIKPAEIIKDYYVPQLFEKVYVVGAPSGDFPIILDTYISAFLPREKISIAPLSDDGNKFIMISEEVLPGHSGSPVYTKDGRVIGIIFGALPDYGGMAASSDDIKLFLFN